MKKERELDHLEINKRKADARVATNLTLLGISITLFGLIVTINPKLLENTLLVIQLVISIPLFTSSTFARSKMAYCQHKGIERFGFFTFLFGYGFLINSIGLLLINFTAAKIAIIFFIANMLLAVLYTCIQVYYHKSDLESEIYQDIAFIILIVLLGILPVLKVY